MTMITVVAKQTVRPDKIADFISIASKLVEETLRSDAGCLNYGLFQDSQHPEILSFIEEWENPDVLDKHLASDHFKELAPKLDQFLDNPVEITRYQKVK